LDYPDKESLEYSIAALADTGVKVMITELDIRTRARGYRGADIGRINRQSTSDSNADAEQTSKGSLKNTPIFSRYSLSTRRISRVSPFGAFMTELHGSGALPCCLTGTISLNRLSTP
jgi:hypothetical protein